jgi:branched-chain amino acid transport system permease protein
MLYHLQQSTALGPELHFMGAPLNAQSAESWFGAAMVLVCGIALFELTRRHFVGDWERIQGEIEKEIKRREALI